MRHVGSVCLVAALIHSPLPPAVGSLHLKMNLLKRERQYSSAGFIRWPAHMSVDLLKVRDLEVQEATLGEALLKVCA